MRHVVEDNQDAPGKPLTEPVFLILTSLADQPRHGYALIQDIEQISGRRVRLSTSTLYGAIRHAGAAAEEVLTREHLDRLRAAA